MSQPYIGEIRIFAGNFAPVGWMLCDGSLLSIDENTTLFQLIGTTYGGDGQSTFALPDLRSRVPVHVGPGFALAQNGGEETVTLGTAQMPLHTHVAVASATTDTSPSPAGNLWAGGGTSQFSDQQPNAQLAASAVQAVGGSQPHDSMLPFVAVNFIISLFGVFPSQ